MTFISDVIYGLKQEYGKPAIFRTRTETTDLETGAITYSNSDFTVPLVIPLPETLRQSFTRLINPQRAGYLKQGEREILIDKADLINEINLNHQMILNNIVYKLTEKPEVYDEAVIIKVSHD